MVVVFFVALPFVVLLVEVYFGVYLVVKVLLLLLVAVSDKSDLTGLVVLDNFVPGYVSEVFFFPVYFVALIA